MAAVVETEHELDSFMHHRVPAFRSSSMRATWPLPAATCCASSTTITARITHVHTKDVRMAVIKGSTAAAESFLDAVYKGAFTVPGDGSLDFEAIVKKLAPPTAMRAGSSSRPNRTRRSPRPSGWRRSAPGN
jgi:inosose dehydratase